MDTPQPNQISTNPITDFQKCKGCKKDVQRRLKPEIQALGGALTRYKDRPEAWLAELDKEGFCVACAKINMQEAGWRARQEAEQRLASLDKEREFERMAIAALDSTRTDPPGRRPYDEFRFELYRPEMNGTHAWLARAKAFKWKTENLYVYGPTGAGKTFLGTAIALEVLRAGGRAEVYMFSKLMELILDKTPDQERAILNHLKRLHCLVIDDLGTGTGTETKYEFLQEILTARYNAYQNGLIITGNLPLGGDEAILGVAEKYGDKIADRINGMCEIVEIDPETPSARGLKKQERKNES